MTDKYAELRRLAESATPGPWESVKRSEYDGSYYFLIQTQEERNGWEIAEIRMDVPHDNAAFIAAANPSTILALLDELEAAQRDARIGRLTRRVVADLYDSPKSALNAMTQAVADIEP